MMSILRSQQMVWVVLALGFVLGMFGALTITSVNAQQTAPRTQYDSFALDTPDVAVQTFVDTFHKRDYAGLFLIFAPQTQMAFTATFTRFNFEWIIAPEAVEALRDNLSFGFNHTETEHSPQLAAYLFDDVMLFAESQDAFPIDLRGDVQILRSEPGTIPPFHTAESSEDEDDTPLPVVDVITSVEDIKDEVIFRMVPTPSGRWQVLQVIAAGGDEERMPWSIVPPEEDED